MNFNHYCFFDFETTGKNKYTAQPVQLAAAIVDGRKLTVLDRFESLVKPEFDEKVCEKKNWAPLTEESIKIHGKTKEMLEKAPNLKIVWSNFVAFVQRYNPKKDKWNSPIMAGFNIKNYDTELVRRCCELYGPYDKIYGAQSLFHPFNSFDVMDDIYKWTENRQDMKSISMDTVREWMGISKKNAHDAMKDVNDGAAIMVKYLKLYRHFSPKIKFEKCFGETE